MPYILLFNLETDFDNDLKLKADAMGAKIPVSLDTLHAHWCMNADTKEELARYANDWKARYLQLKKDLADCESGTQ